MNNYGSGITIQRTTATEWTVYKKGVSMGAFASRVLAESTAAGLISNNACIERLGNKKAATAEVQVITMTSFAGTDSFSIKSGDLETVPFVRGTNAVAVTHLTPAIAAVTGDASATVAGTTDEGPYTVSFAATTRQPLLQQGTVSGCTAAITVTTTGGVGL